MGIHTFYVIPSEVDNICYKHQNMLWKYIKDSLKSIIKDAERHPYDFETHMKHTYKSWSNIFFAGSSKLLPYICKESKILDYGFGCGTIVLNLLLLGYDAYGIDIDAEKHAYVIQLIDDLYFPSEWKEHFIVYDGKTICFDSSEFDFVFCDYVLEHVANCSESLNEMLRVCKKNGCIQLNCPNYDFTYEPHFFLDLKKPIRGNKAEFCELVKANGGNEEYVDTLNFINTQDVYDMLDKLDYQLEITDCRKGEEVLKDISLLIRKK